MENHQKDDVISHNSRVIGEIWHQIQIQRQRYTPYMYFDLDVLLKFKFVTACYVKLIMVYINNVCISTLK